MTFNIQGKEHAMKPSTLLSIICFLGIPIASAFSGASAKAEDYPARPVKIIVQTPAGSSVDVTARILANHFTNLWGQQVVVLNLPGGGGTIAARAAATAAPDGYTMFMPATSIFVSMPELYPDTSINLSRDLVPVGFVGEQPLAIAVSPSLGVNSLKDLIALSQKQPEKINWAAITPVGTLPHLTGELFRSRSGACQRGRAPWRAGPRLFASSCPVGYGTAARMPSPREGPALLTRRLMP
jgi:tripartite-type tricarboxylate transporter receptor subunit TctC